MGTTNFPANLDDLPAVSADANEMHTPGLEHDVVHDNLHVIVMAIQAKIGVDGSLVETSLDFRMAALEGFATEVDADLDAINTALAGKAAASHTHDASEIDSGQLNTARIAAGTAPAGYVPKSNGDGTASWAAESGGGGGQAAIQFSIGGTVLGAAGAVTAIDFAGASVAAAIDGTAVTVTIVGGGTGGSALNYRRDDLAAAAGNNTITLAATPYQGAVEISRNGVLLPVADYTVDGLVYALDNPAAGADVFVVRYWTESASPGATTLTTVANGGVGPRLAWRLRITANDGSVSFIGIGEMQLRAAIGGADQTAAVANNPAVSVSSQINTSNAGYMAFDNNASTGWLAANATPPATITYTFAAPTDVLEYTIQGPGNEITASPRDWELQYSDDGSSWSAAHTVTGQTGWTVGQVRTFAVGA